jgi:hypothetical protein
MLKMHTDNRIIHYTKRKGVIKTVKSFCYCEVYSPSWNRIKRATLIFSPNWEIVCFISSSTV